MNSTRCRFNSSNTRRKFRPTIHDTFFSIMSPTNEHSKHAHDDASSQTSVGRFTENDALLNNSHANNNDFFDVEKSPSICPSSEEEENGGAYVDCMNRQRTRRQKERVGLKLAAIDFHAAALYIPVAQIVVALLVCSATAIFAAWVLPHSQTSAARTVTLCGIVGIGFVVWPLTVAPCVGLDICFDAIRPCVPLYIFALILEQLTHGSAEAMALSNAKDQNINDVSGWSFRSAYFHFCISIAVIGGFMRALSPKSEGDAAFVVSSLAFVLASAWPPLPPPGLGPLCEVKDGWEAAERLVRAATFGVVYCALAYASEPKRYGMQEILLCSARAAAASAWILAVVTPALPLAIVQLGILLCRRMRSRQNEMTDVPLSSVGSIDDLESSSQIGPNSQGNHLNENHGFTWAESNPTELLVQSIRNTKDVRHQISPAAEENQTGHFPVACEAFAKRRLQASQKQEEDQPTRGSKQDADRSLFTFNTAPQANDFASRLSQKMTHQSAQNPAGTHSSPKSSVSSSGFSSAPTIVGQTRGYNFSSLDFSGDK